MSRCGRARSRAGQLCCRGNPSASRATGRLRSTLGALGAISWIPCENRVSSVYSAGAGRQPRTGNRDVAGRTSLGTRSPDGALRRYRGRRRVPVARGRKLHGRTVCAGACRADAERFQLPSAGNAPGDCQGRRRRHADQHKRRSFHNVPPSPASIDGDSGPLRQGRSLLGRKLPTDRCPSKSSQARMSGDPHQLNWNQASTPFHRRFGREPKA